MRTSQAERETVTKIIWRVLREEGGWTTRQVSVTNIRQRRDGAYSAHVVIEKAAASGRIAQRRYRAVLGGAGLTQVKITAIGPAGWQDESTPQARL